MKPIKAAIQLSKMWREICPEGNEYPVDCRLLAEALNIKVHGAEIDDNFEAQLRIRGKQRVIIYNENIREEGRKNFCISHELGHHSCHTNKDEFVCTDADLNDMNPHPENIEQEANLFAANLLMPADDFRIQVAGKKVDMASLIELADARYKTSLTATCKRLIDLSQSKYYGIAVVKNGQVVRWDRTGEMKWTGFGFCKGQQIDITRINHDNKRTEVDSDIWLSDKNSPKWKIFQSSVEMPYYNQAMYLIEAERIAEQFQDEVEEAPLSGYLAH